MDYHKPCLASCRCQELLSGKLWVLNIDRALAGWRHSSDVIYGTVKNIFGYAWLSLLIKRVCLNLFGLKHLKLLPNPTLQPPSAYSNKLGSVLGEVFSWHPVLHCFPVPPKHLQILNSNNPPNHPEPTFSTTIRSFLSPLFLLNFVSCALRKHELSGSCQN